MAPLWYVETIYCMYFATKNQKFPPVILESNRQNDPCDPDKWNLNTT